MTEGTLVKWRKQKGDPIEIGDILAEVETDKATMEMESFDEGVLDAIYVNEGGKVLVGEPLAFVRGDGETTPAVATPAAVSSASVSSMAGPASGAPATAAPAPAAKPTGERVKSSPLARKVAAERGVALDGLAGSGPGGRIVVKDIPASGAAPKPAAPRAAATTPPPAGLESTRIALSGMRRVIAERLLESKTQIPHFYLHIEVDVAQLTKIRKQLNEAAEATGVPKVTINDFVLLATARAAVQVPAVNATFAGDAIIQFSSVNLSVAVAVDDGLVTPVVRDAQNLSLGQISAAVKDVASRARNKKLKPEEYQGGTITISNLGAYGIERFAAIINPPQSAILAVGAIVKKPVVNERDEIVIGHRMSVSLSCDHRVVDGAVGAEFLNAIRRYLETPALMLF